MTDTIIYKTCTKCNESKPETSFPNEIRKGKRKRLARCQQCINKYINEHYHKTNERRAELRAIRYQRDDRKILKDWLVSRKILFTPAYFQSRWQATYWRAKKHGIHFELTVQDLRELFADYYGICPLCEKQLDKPSIDRIDTEKGYFRKNCGVICCKCNSRKSRTTKGWVIRLYLYMFGDMKPSDVK